MHSRPKRKLSANDTVLSDTKKNRFSLSIPLEPLLFAGNLLDDIPFDIILMHVSLYLTRADHINLGMTASPQRFFRTKESLHQLAELVAKYHIFSNTFDNDAYIKKLRSQSLTLIIDDEVIAVKNPVLLLVHAILMKNPQYLTARIAISDHTNRYHECSIAQYACWSSNFMLKELISQRITGGQAALAEAMAEIFQSENNFNLVLLPLVPPEKTALEVFYHCILIWPENQTLPFCCDDLEILLQKCDNELLIFRMVDGQLTHVNSIPLTSTDFSNYLNEHSIVKFVTITKKGIRDNVIAALATDTPYYLTPGQTPLLFDDFRIFCQFSFPLPLGASLAKHFDENNNVILTLFGIINSKIKATTLTHALHLMARNVFFPSRLPPIQNGVVLVYEGDEVSYLEAMQKNSYVAYFVNEGSWIFIDNTPLHLATRSLTQAVITHQQFELIHFLYNSVGLHSPAAHFIDLQFPTINDGSYFLTAADITPEQYLFLQSGHSYCYDIKEYLRGLTAFYQKYPFEHPIPQESFSQVEFDWYQMVGKTQFSMPSWLAQIWCSDTPFNPTPNMNKLILHTQTRKLYVENIQQEENLFYRRTQEHTISKGRHNHAFISDAIDLTLEEEEETDSLIIEEDAETPIVAPEDYFVPPQHLVMFNALEAQDYAGQEEEQMLNPGNIGDLGAMLELSRLINKSYCHAKNAFLIAQFSPRP